MGDLDSYTPLKLLVKVSVNPINNQTFLTLGIYYICYGDFYIGIIDNIRQFK